MRSRTAYALHAVALLALAAPGGAQPQWQLVEDLRIGGEASEATIFTDIRSVVAGPQGQIFVLDARPQELRMFDRSGKFVATLARRGQGPGEIARANGLLLVRDTIWANDPSNGRWSAWSAVDGRYTGQITIPILSFGFLWEAGLDAEGRIVDPISVIGSRSGPDGTPLREPRWRRVRTDGRVVDTIPAPACAQRNPPAKIAFSGMNTKRAPGALLNTFIQIPFLPRPLAVMDGRGGIWCSPNDEYTLIHIGLERGDTLHAVRRPYARLPLARAARDSAIDEARKSLARFEVVDADYSLVPSAHPVFDRLAADDKGQLWARRVVKPGAPLQFDVFDGRGRQVAVATTVIPFVPLHPVHVRGDHVYGMIVDEEDVPHVVRARIVRSR